MQFSEYERRLVAKLVKRHNPFDNWSHARGGETTNEYVALERGRAQWIALCLLLRPV